MYSTVPFFEMLVKIIQGLSRQGTKGLLEHYLLTPPTSIVARNFPLYKLRYISSPQKNTSLKYNWRLERFRQR